MCKIYRASRFKLENLVVTRAVKVAVTKDFGAVRSVQGAVVSGRSSREDPLASGNPVSAKTIQ